MAADQSDGVSAPEAAVDAGRVPAPEAVVDAGWVREVDAGWVREVDAGWVPAADAGAWAALEVDRVGIVYAPNAAKLFRMNAAFHAPRLIVRIAAYQWFANSRLSDVQPCWGMQNP